jgi:hypothetical protein
MRGVVGQLRLRLPKETMGFYRGLKAKQKRRWAEIPKIWAKLVVTWGLKASRIARKLASRIYLNKKPFWQTQLV